MTATLPATDFATPRAVATRSVLHVINGEHYSGAERVQDLLAQELPHCGFDVSFACVKPQLFPSARQCQQAPLYRAPMRGRFDLKCGRELATLIRREQFELVHAHTPRALLVGTIAAREAGVPLVYHVHSPTANDSTRRLQNFFNARLERWLLRGAAKLIAVSPSLATRMVQQGIDSDRVAYVPNGVPAVPPQCRRRPFGKWKLGMAALFRPRKGVEVLLGALADLRNQGYDLQLRAIGPFETPEYQQEVMALADKLNIANAIHWTGFVTDVHRELCDVDLFVLPSLFGEGLPMVLLEALAAGLPVVATNVEGIPTAVRHGVDGVLVEPGSSNELAAAIASVIRPDSTFDYLAMCDSAREHHAAQFSTAAMAEGVAHVYRDVLDNKE